LLKGFYKKKKDSLRARVVCLAARGKKGTFPKEEYRSKRQECPISKRGIYSSKRQLRKTHFKKRHIAVGGKQAPFQKEAYSSRRQESSISKRFI